MKILSFTYGLASANMYVLLFGEQAVVIDPCCPWKETGLSNIKVKSALCTHGHFDHIAETDDIVSLFSCPVYISKEDSDMLPDPDLNHASSFGLDIAVATVPSVFQSEVMLPEDLNLSTEEGFKMRIIRTPGHTSGSVCFLFEFEDDDKKIMFTGDTLFKFGIGRTDLGGSDEDMQRSIDLLRSMDDDIECYPGHGPSTNLMSEKRMNPFFF